jgi:hypothetical protein
MHPLPAGGDVLLSEQDDMLIEYDAASRSPVGVVAFLEGRSVALVDAAGQPPRAEDGADLAAVLLTDPSSGEVTRLGRNEAGSFFRVFQHNKWVAKKKAEAEALAAAAAAEVVVSA